MNRSLSLIALCSVLMTAVQASAAPSDFDGNGRSDLSVVINSLTENGAPSFDWAIANGAGSEIFASNFGQPGDLLAPGHYTQSEISEPGFISADGTWTVRSSTGADLQFQHGAEHAMYVSGVDLDGNGESDAVYYTNACKQKRAEVFARINPAGTFQQNAKIKSGRGKYYIAFGDVDGDGADDVCSLTPGASGGKFTKNFLMICQDFLSGKVISRFRVDKVYQQPVPVTTKVGKDVFVFPKRLKKGNRTLLSVRGTDGKKLAELAVPGHGAVLVGHYTNDEADAEQVAVVDGNNLSVWDIGSNAVYTAAIADGTLFDEYGVQGFGEDETCFCTSANIGKSKNCRQLFTKGGGAGSSGNPGKGSGGGGSNVGGGASCPGGTATPGGGALWKPSSDFAPGPRYVNAPHVSSSSCRYERADGSVFMNFINNGYGNPIGGVDRQHWKPASEVNCGSYPSGRIVCNNVCWSIPNPCGRYE